MSTDSLETENFRVTYEVNDEVRNEVFRRVLAFFVKHESFHGECIMQSDDPQIEAAPLLSEIADEVFKFNIECK